MTRVQRGRMGLQRILVALALAASAVGVAGATRASATVTTLNGSYQYTHSDASLAVDGSGFQFRRTYNSPDIRLTQIGPGWTYNFNSRLDAVAAGSPDIYFIGEYGRSDYMVARADGTWLPRDPGVEDSLKRLPTGEYEVTTNSGQEPATWTFNSGGVAVAVQQTGKPRLSIIRGAHGPERVQLADGRGVFTFGYEPQSGLMTSVCDVPDPRSTDTPRCSQFGYDQDGRLTSVADRMNAITRYTYDGASQRLTSIIDARGNPADNLTYDDRGRVASRRDARAERTGLANTFVYDSHVDGSAITHEHRVPSAFAPDWFPTFTDYYDSLPRIVRATHEAAPGEDAEDLSYDWATEHPTRRHSGGATPAVSSIAVNVRTGPPGASSVVVGDRRDPLPTPTCIAAQPESNAIVTWARPTTSLDPRAPTAQAMAQALMNPADVMRDGYGRPTQFRDSAGQIWRIVFDPEDHLTRIMGPTADGVASTPIVEYAYDSVGNVRAVDDADGSSEFAYNERDQLSDAAWASGIRADYQYDDAGDLVAAQAQLADGSVHAADYRHDALHRIRTYALHVTGLDSAPMENLVFAYDTAGGCSAYRR